MKKTLIALATVAVTTGAMAQVTLSGGISMGWESNTVAAGTSTTGFGTQDAFVKFNASEDLGGGLKVTSSFFIESITEGDTPDGGDAILTLSGGFGALQLSSADAGDFLPVDGLTASSEGVSLDRFTYTLPTLVPGLAVALTAHDGDLSATGAATSGDGITTIATTYTTGPIKGEFNYSNYSVDTTDTKVQYAGTYDFGVAKVRYGVTKVSYPVSTGTSDITESGLTITVPVSSDLTVTLASAKAKTATVAARSGSSLNVKYALSKRTNVSLYTESYTKTAGDVSKTKETILKMNHSF
jgi:hypothetical protein